MGFNVEFYRTSGVKCIIEDFLDSLDSKVAQKVTWVLSLIEDLERVPIKYFKKLTGSDGIWEVRVETHIGFIRIFGFIAGQNLWLTHGIIKKTDKTPKTDINKAEQYKNDYYERRQLL